MPTRKDLKRLIEQECNRGAEEIRERMRREGRKFIGAKRVKKFSPYTQPRKPRKCFERVPHVACKARDLRIRYLEWRKDRQRSYEEKRLALLEGQRNVVFPEGTYALWKHCGQVREPWQG